MAEGSSDTTPAGGVAPNLSAWSMVDSVGKGQGDPTFTDDEWRHYNTQVQQQYQQHLQQLQQQLTLSQAQQQATATAAAAQGGQDPAQQQLLNTILQNQQWITNQMQQQQQAQQASNALPQLGSTPGFMKKLTPPTLPSPIDSYKIYVRAVEEFRAESKDFREFQIVKAIKDALPEELRVIASDRMSITDMEKAGSVDVLLAWIKDRYDDLPGEEILDTKRQWQAFKRTGPCLRTYVDAFEQHLVKLTRLGKRPDEEDARDLLLIKADLPDIIESDLRLQLHRLVQNANKADWTYTDLKNELLLIGKRPELLQRRVNFQEVTTPGKGQDAGKLNPAIYAAFDPANDGKYQREPGGAWFDRDQPVNYVNFTKGKGKGKKGKSDKPCFHFQNNKCTRGASCAFSHATASDRGRSPQRWNASPTPTRSHSSGRPPNATRESCRYFSRGQCSRGRHCMFAHDKGRNDGYRSDRSRSPRFQGTRSPSRSPPPRFGGSRSPSNSRSRYSPQRTQRGAPSRSPRPPPRSPPRR